MPVIRYGIDGILRIIILLRLRETNPNDKWEIAEQRVRETQTDDQRKIAKQG